MDFALNNVIMSKLEEKRMTVKDLHMSICDLLGGGENFVKYPTFADRLKKDSLTAKELVYIEAILGVDVSKLAVLLKRNITTKLNKKKLHEYSLLKEVANFLNTYGLYQNDKIIYTHRHIKKLSRNVFMAMYVSFEDVAIEQITILGKTCYISGLARFIDFENYLEENGYSISEFVELSEDEKLKMLMDDANAYFNMFPNEKEDHIKHIESMDEEFVKKFYGIDLSYDNLLKIANEHSNIAKGEYKKGDIKICHLLTVSKDDIGLLLEHYNEDNTSVVMENISIKNGEFKCTSIGKLPHLDELIKIHTNKLGVSTVDKFKELSRGKKEMFICVIQNNIESVVGSIDAFASMDYDSRNALYLELFDEAFGYKNQ